MSDDIVRRLRGGSVCSCAGVDVVCDVCVAANEIEELRGVISEWCDADEAYRVARVAGETPGDWYEAKRRSRYAGIALKRVRSRWHG